MGERKTFEEVGGWEALGCFRLNTRWARVSSIVDAGLDDSEDVMDSDK